MASLDYHNCVNLVTIEDQVPVFYLDIFSNALYAKSDSKYPLFMTNPKIIFPIVILSAFAQPRSNTHLEKNHSQAFQGMSQWLQIPNHYLQNTKPLHSKKPSLSYLPCYEIWPLH
jgi:hypothetical protein